MTSLQQEQNQLAVRLNDLLEQKRAQVDRIDAPLLKTYQALGERRRGVAVAVIKHDMCDLCGVRISDRKVRAARMGEKVYCGSCGRILVLV